MKTLGLYMHIPFCENKCPYCNFYSGVFSEDIKEAYKNKLIDEIKIWGKKINRKVDTVYFGGGTPNLMGTDRLIEILSQINKSFKLLKNTEITIEMNPNSTDDIGFDILKYNGVNRLSVGLQSDYENDLLILGRKHSSKDVKNTVLRAYKSGIENISLDLMLCVPNQKISSVKKSIDFCKDLNIKHISAYILKIEPSTPYYKNREKLSLIDEDKQGEIYIFACDYIESLGFKQYEVSNFSLKGYESLHNLKYWNSDEYLGLGPSAHSFLEDKRFYTKASLKEFLLKPEYISEDTCNLIKSGSIEEYLMLRLRIREGVQNIEFKRRFGFDIPETYFKNAYRFKNTGLIDITDKYIKLSRDGFLVSNYLISEIVLGTV